MDDYPTCTAKAKTTGKRCQNPAIPGGKVCRIHGGAAPQVRAKAAERVFEALVGPGLIQYRQLIEDPSTPPHVRLRALIDLFDRTGHKPANIVGFLTEAQLEAEIARLESEQIE